MVFFCVVCVPVPFLYLLSRGVGVLFKVSQQLSHSAGVATSGLQGSSDGSRAAVQVAVDALPLRSR